MSLSATKCILAMLSSLMRTGSRFSGVLDALRDQLGQSGKAAELRDALDQALKESVDRENPADDFKNASSHFVTSARQLLGINAGGSTPSVFLRDTMAPRLRPRMTPCEALRADVFGVENLGSLKDCLDDTGRQSP